MNKLTGNFSFKTDIGQVRMTNDDQAFAGIDNKNHCLLCVCDGMGGENHGDLASRLAMDIIKEEFERKSFSHVPFLNIHRVKSIIRKANSLIYDEASKNDQYKGMGTTLTLALIGEDQLILIQVGDSRCYMLQDGSLKQLSEDQTYVGYLYRSGQITEAEMLTHPKRHVLLNALGIYPGANLDVKVLPYHGESLLLCSDGLYNNVPVKDIEAIVRSDDSAHQKVEELIKLANSNGGSDNIAVSYWECNK